MATEYIKANIKGGEVSSANDINKCIENFNEAVYNYFAENRK